LLSFRFARKTQPATAVIVASLLLVALLLLVRSVFAAGNGDGTAPAGSGTILGTPVHLAETFNATLNGDYVAAGVAMRGTDPGGGTITLPAIPGGATIQNAFLYWSVMNDGTPTALSQGTINGNPITGALIATTADPCWAGVSEIHNYRANINPAFVVTGGANTLSGFASNANPLAQPMLQGASLVVVYEDPGSPLKQIVIRHGGVTFRDPPPVTTTFSTSPTVAGTSKTTWIVADGQPEGIGVAGETNNKTYVEGTVTATEVLRGDDPPANIWFWDTLTQDISGFVPPGTTSVQVGVESTAGVDDLVDCLTWVAQVLSVPAPTPTPPPPPPDPDAVGGIVEMTVGSPEPFSPDAGSSGGVTWLLVALLGIAAVLGTAYAGIRGLTR
jgi:hypothetical protein